MAAAGLRVVCLLASVGRVATACCSSMSFLVAESTDDIVAGLVLYCVGWYGCRIGMLGLRLHTFRFQIRLVFLYCDRCIVHSYS